MKKYIYLSLEEKIYDDLIKLIPEYKVTSAQKLLRKIIEEKLNKEPPCNTI